MASIRKRPGRTKPWEARWRDPDGRDRSTSFLRKIDAQRFLTTTEADQLRGSYVDPAAGRVTFGDYAREWLARQTTDPTTREATERRVRLHMLPTFDGVALRQIKPSHVQTWLHGLDASPSHAGLLLGNLSTILNAAVDDGLIPHNPCRSSSVRAPRDAQERIVPWERERVDAVIAAHPERYRTLPVVAAGTGLRQGECFGLAVEDVDFLRRTVHVRRQVKLVGGQPVLDLPKGGKQRDVPLAEPVAVALAEHMRTYPPQTIALPWRDRSGDAVSAALLVTTGTGAALRRNSFGHVWRAALRRAGVEPSRENGMHALRHYYASALLAAGVDVRALADYLGHADPGFTLRIYTHLMPQAEDRARAAIDSALGSRGPHVGQEAEG